MEKTIDRFGPTIFALALLAAFSFSCFQFGSLGVLHILMPGAALENSGNSDGDDFVMDSPAKSKGIFSSFPNPPHPGIHALKDSLRLPFQPFSSKQEISVLRC